MIRRIPWWDWLPLPWRRWRIVLYVEAGDEIPERLPRNSAVLVCPSGQPTWLAFDCPCRTGHRIMVNLHNSRRPRWTIEQHDGPVTLSPSIDDVGEGRRCHFFLWGGRITWVQNEERTNQT